MTTKNEQQCGFCGGTKFDFAVGETFRWMEVGCYKCELFLEVRKADTSAAALGEPNRSHAINRYVAHTERLVMQILKNDAAVETK